MTVTDAQLNAAARKAVARLDWILDAEDLEVSVGLTGSQTARKSVGGEGQYVPPNWRELRLCEDSIGDWVTLPQRVGVKAARAAKAYELSFCEACPVAVPCLEYALEKPEWIGIYGGKLPVERRKIVNAQEPRCGTQAGFQAHRRRREVPCSDCRRAFNQAQAQRKRRRKAKA